jgi:hypothetical protein
MGLCLKVLPRFPFKVLKTAAALKQRWGTLQRVLSSRDRLEQIANDIILDMEMKPRLNAGRGNTMLVAGSIPEACDLFEIFRKSGSILADKCAIVTSYKRVAPEITGEEAGMPHDSDQFEQIRLSNVQWKLNANRSHIQMCRAVPWPARHRVC